MKKLLLIVLSLGLSLNLFAQKVIEKPVCEGISSCFTVEKVILGDTVTNIVISYKNRPKTWYKMVKSSFIRVDNNPEKLIVTSANGREFDKEYWLDKTGSTTLIYSFPAISKDAKIIHFKENENGNENDWKIDNIYLQPGLLLKYMPDEFAGNWMTSDAQHKWTISFTKNTIIYKGKPYILEEGNYEVKNKNEIYVLTIGKKKLYLKKENSQLYIGESKKSMIPCVKINFSQPLKGIASYPIPEMRINQDTAYYRGFLVNYNSKQGKTGAAHVDNIFSGEQEQYLIKIDSTGWFEVKLPMCYPEDVYFRMPDSDYSVFLVPGDTLTQLIKNRKAISYGKYGAFNDEYQFISLISRSYDYKKVSKEIGNMTIADYNSYCKEVYEKDLSIWAKFCKEFNYNNQIVNIGKRNIKMYYMVNYCDYSMKKSSYAYKLEKEGKTYNYDKMDSGCYCNMLKDLPVDKESFFSYGRFSSLINRLEFADCFNKNSFNGNLVFDKLLENGLKISKEDSAVIKNYKTVKDSKIIKLFSENTDSLTKNFWPLLNNYDKGWYKKYSYDKRKSKDERFYGGLKSYLIEQKDKPFSKEGFNLLNKIIAFETPEYIEEYDKLNSASKEFNKVIEKYKQDMDEEISMERTEYKRQKFMDCMGERGQLLSDVMISRDLCPTIEKPEPLSLLLLKYVDENVKTKFIKDYIHESNQKIIEHISANKKNTNYKKHEVPETEGEKVFAKIIKPYKGKVIYVDFWATWCGACVSGIKRIAPLKEELIKRGDIVFLYITNVTSPEKLYNNMIPDIKGEHYRISKDQWNYLSDKFNITGIPHYVLVNKKGEVVINDKGIEPYNNLKSVLLKYAKE